MGGGAGITQRDWNLLCSVVVFLETTKTINSLRLHVQMSNTRRVTGRHHHRGYAADRVEKRGCERLKGEEV